MRNLRTRLDRLASGTQSDAILQALEQLGRTGIAPSGPAGDRASEIRREADAMDLDEVARAMWIHMRATGKSVVEMLHPAHFDGREGSAS